MVEVRGVTEEDRPWVVQVETDSWGEPVVARRGELIDPTGLPGFIAFVDGQPAGLVSYAVRGDECEVVTIRSLREGQGIGRALLDAVRDAASEARCRRLWLVTTNNNVRALGLYQRWGMDIVALHRHAVSDARSLKPSIPDRDARGIPIADEVELELRLGPRIRGVHAELRDITAGLWLWRVPHPDWSPEADWQPPVASTCVESRGEVALLDPIAPPDDVDEVWSRLDARPPTMLVVLKPDHVRDVDLFARRYGARAFGPWLFWKSNVPETELEPIEPGSELPGGLVALYDGRGRNETPLWLPEQRALVFADALTAPGGELRVWRSPSHEERALPALRALLELPFEHVIVSHGESVHDRAAYERALELPPWG